MVNDKGKLIEARYLCTFEVRNFTYNGFMGQNLPGKAPYTATFIEWTDDPGVARCSCSDGEERLIPSFAFLGDRSTLPNQDMSNRVFFGRPSHS